MYSFNTSNLNQKMQNGVKLLSKKFGFCVSKSGIILTYSKCEKPVLHAACDGKNFNITAPNEVSFYRAIGLLIKSEGNTLDVTESIDFCLNGTMFDNSRNGVLTVERTKDFILDLAIMGQNAYMPYIEDVYELENEPLFGFLRGKYTKAELKEIDDFAYSLGIEVIPCIQTLAHLMNFLKWRRELIDANDIMFVGKKEVNALVEKMFAFFNETLRTRRIHVGMDEAYSVGRGNYLDKNGYKPKGEVVAEQLRFVCSVAKKYGYKIMMWDDMFFSHYGNVAKAPENVDFVFWEYFNKVNDFYEKEYEKRKQSKNNVVFAGGLIRWTGFCPRYSLSLNASNAALTTAKKYGVKDVFVTLWGDDGSICPAESGLVGSMQYAEMCYGHDLESADINGWCKLIFGTDYNTILMEEKFDTAFCEYSAQIRCFNSIFFYTDPIIATYGLYIERISKIFDVNKELESIYKFFKNAKTNNSYKQVSFEYYCAFAKALKYKWNINLLLTEAYKKADKQAMENILKNNIIPAKNAVKKFREVFYKKWMLDYKSNGLEIADGRFGYIEARLATAERIVKAYIKGDKTANKALLPLLEERQPIFNNPDKWPCNPNSGPIMYAGTAHHCIDFPF